MHRRTDRYGRWMAITCFRLILAATMVLIFAATATAQETAVRPNERQTSGPGTFRDFSPEDPAGNYVIFLQNKGVVAGFPDGTFRPQSMATRAQAAKMLATLLDLYTSQPESPTYSDVPEGHWGYGYVEATTKAGLWQGYSDGTFRPDTVLTRAEVATVLSRLVGEKPPITTGKIADVPRDHWAYMPVAEAMEAGLLPPTATGFSPDAAAGRLELSRGLALAYTLAPERVWVELKPRVRVLEPEVWITTAAGRQPLTAPVRARAGDIIETGSRGRAEVIFDDGSSLRLEPNTVLKLDRLGGYLFIGADGKEKGGVGQIDIALTRGTLFGALAANYVEEPGENLPQVPTGNQRDPVHGSPIILGTLASISPRLPESPLIRLAAADQNAVPWYLQPYQKKVRVKVNMPWGVAGIRGTFWRNEVTGTGFSTSILVGEAGVTAAGQTVELAQGQHTQVAAEQPPAPPAPMPVQEKQKWTQVETWVKEKDKAIRENKAQVPRQEARQIATSLLAAPPLPGEVPPGATVPPVPTPPQPPVPPGPPLPGPEPPGEAGPTAPPTPPAVTGEATTAIENLVQEVETQQPEEPVSPPREEGGPSGPVSYQLPVTPGTPLATPDGLVRVTVPAGVYVPEGVTLDVTPVSGLQPPAGLALAGQMVDISFGDNWQPEVPVTIALAYNPGLSFEQVNKLTIYHLVNSTWVWEPTSRRSEGYVLADISQFSVFTVLADTTGPAGLTASVKEVSAELVTLEFTASDSSRVKEFILERATGEPPDTIPAVDNRGTRTVTGLDPAKEYHWTARAVDVFDNRSDPVPVNFTTTPAPPAVTGSRPEPGAVNVSIHAPLVITFNQAIVPGSAFDSLALTDASGQPVPIAKTISNTTDLVVTPEEPLAYNNGYILTLPAGAVTNAQGQCLAEPYSLIFTTEAQTLATLDLTGLARSTFVVGETLVLGDLTLTGVDQHGLPYDLEGKAMTWQSSNEDVATVTVGVHGEPVLVMTGLGPTQVTAMVDGVVSDALEVTGQLVVTDRNEYRVGGTVTILAALPGPDGQPLPGIQVAVEVRDESGRVKYVDQVTTGASGQAEMAYVLADTPISRITPGIYTVWASFRYGAEAYMATIAFTVWGSQK
ncbi:MAG: hypothetical protein D9V47_06565 [Clostridia bacterium]|nr:MAG: hypothetical protein D9V47_06565 [Clostridia bacterium]